MQGAALRNQGRVPIERAGFPANEMTPFRGWCGMLENMDPLIAGYGYLKKPWFSNQTFYLEQNVDDFYFPFKHRLIPACMSKTLQRPAV